ncbi:HpcH/HpaI aldolase family protein [Streptomyces sp. NPDC005055]
MDTLPQGARTRFREAIQNGRRLQGIFIASSDPATTEIAGSVGFDYVVCDNEHGPLDIPTIANHVRAAEARGVIPMARLLKNDRYLIGKMLDIGVEGLLVPHVDTAEDAARAVAATRFAPHGERGMCPSSHAGRYSTRYWADFQPWSEANVLVIPIIESRKAVKNIDEILAVDGIDMVNFGPGDLSTDMQVAIDGPEILEARKRVVEAARAHDVHVMMSFVGPPPPEGEALLFAMELMVLRQALENLIER